MPKCPRTKISTFQIHSPDSWACNQKHKRQQILSTGRPLQGNFSILSKHNVPRYIRNYASSARSILPCTLIITRLKIFESFIAFILQYDLHIIRRWAWNFWNRLKIRNESVFERLLHCRDLKLPTSQNYLWNSLKWSRSTDKRERNTLST